MKIPLSFSYLIWLLMQDAAHIYVHKQIKDAYGPICMAKFRSSQRWKLECIVWPPSEGRKTLHVPVGAENKGWFIMARFSLKS